jgi:valyl-tRNA synthetase
VYRYIPGTEGTIMLSDWPKAEPQYDFPAEARAMEGVMDVIRSVRNLRAEMNVPVGKRAHLMIRPKSGWEDALNGADEIFARLAWASGTQLLGQNEAVNEKTVSCVSEAAEVLIPLGDLVDFEKEIARLKKERDNVANELARGEGKLKNPGFVNKAPAALVEQERAKLEVNRDKLNTLEARLRELTEN